MQSRSFCTNQVHDNRVMVRFQGSRVPGMYFIIKITTTVMYVVGKYLRLT